jgi:hypothetical protein
VCLASEYISRIKLLDDYVRDIYSTDAECTFRASNKVTHEVDCHLERFIIDKYDTSLARISPNI